MQVWLVAGDCFLIGLAPVLVHMSKGPDGKFPFHPVSINLLVEVAKTLFATIILIIYVSLLSCASAALLTLSMISAELLNNLHLQYTCHAACFGPGERYTCRVFLRQADAVGRAGCKGLGGRGSGDPFICSCRV